MITAQTTFRWDCPHCGQYDGGYVTYEGAQYRLMMHYAEECPNPE